MIEYFNPALLVMDYQSHRDTSDEIDNLGAPKNKKVDNLGKTNFIWFDAQIDIVTLKH